MMELKWIWVVMLAFLLGNCCFECDGCWEQEKLALFRLKSFFAGIADIGDWPTPTAEGTTNTSDCCQWKRVECNTTTGRVIVLDLSNDAMTHNKSYRYLNASFFLPFTELKTLYLSKNNLAGCVPSEGFERLSLNLNKLELLELSDNYFNESIFPSLSELSSLMALYLRNNSFAASNLTNEAKGTFGLMNLEVLDLSYNLLNNSILPSLAMFSNLKSLDLSGNKFKGVIDLKELRGLHNLEDLGIDCPTPADFWTPKDFASTKCNILLRMGLFPLMKSLSLEGFSINGTMTAQDWQNLSNLELLEIDSSFLPSNFLQGFGTWISLQQFTLYNCHVNGSISIDQLYYTTISQELMLISSVLPSNFLGDTGTLRSLNSLELGSIKEMASISLNEWQNLTSMEELNIHDSLLPSNFFQDIGTLTSLKSLLIRDSDVVNNGSLSINGLCRLKNLEHLEVRNNSLKGDLPECFSNLTSLQYLDLSFNQFSGNISYLKSLTSLQCLFLSNNNFEIPSSLAPFYNLSKLKEIFVENNTIYAGIEIHSSSPRFQLTDIRMSCCGDVGSFPKFLYYQHELYYVDLSNIFFKGEFPNWLLENNTKFYTLILVNNSLSGPFKLPFSLNSDMSLLDVSNNFLNGNIPIEIGVHLPSLQLLNMLHNHFNGSIPSSIGHMTLLEVLDLSNNQFSRGIPEHLAMGCSSLKFLGLSSNKLQGRMFSKSFNLTSLEQLELDGNEFFGRIPDSLSKSLNLTTLAVSNNQLSGKIPRWMGNMQYLEEILMADNHFQGPIPEEFCKLNHQLRFLDLSMNSISGTLPPCFSPSRVSQVYLSNNRLQGSLPVAFRDSSLLLTLDLSYNHFTGNIPNWISKLSKLSYLLLTRNHFEGKLPIQLCKLPHLSLLDLSHNNLSGHIPHCLKVSALNCISNQYVHPLTIFVNDNPIIIEKPIKYTIKGRSYSYKGRILRFLSGIDLSCNKLTGEIPRETENFRMVNALNFSHNSLTGPIPHALSKLGQIESLDLSFNNLSGNIPPELVELNFLVSFNVSYNNLSGKTPKMFQQFATFDESSYLGNPCLCGTPLQKNCLTTEPPSSSMPKVNDGWIDMTIFYVSFVVCYIVVVLAIGLVLYINPYWRRAWFYHVERVVTSCYYFVVDHLP